MENTLNGKRKVDDISFEEEMWKPCHLSPLYEVSNRGRVRRAENKFVRKNAINPHGYQYLTLPIDGKDYTSLVGRLVLYAFTGYPEDGQVAHHVDGDSSNDDIENLMWTSIAEAGIKRVYPSTISSRFVLADKEGVTLPFSSTKEASYFFNTTRDSIYDYIRSGRKLQGYKIYYDASDPDCEVRDVIGAPSYKISRDGRIRKTNGKWTFGSVHSSSNKEKSYMRTDVQYCIDGQSVEKKKYLHVLVAEAFIGTCPEGYQLDHIDGDTSHNDASNLQYVSKSENNKRAYQNGRKPPNEKAVVLVKLDGTFERYKSASEGNRQTGVSVGGISKKCKHGWKDKDGNFWAHDKPVTRHDFDNNIIEEFESLSVAHKETGENILYILMACRDEEDPSWTIEA